MLLIDHHITRHSMCGSRKDRPHQLCRCAAHLQMSGWSCFKLLINGRVLLASPHSFFPPSSLRSSALSPQNHTQSRPLDPCSTCSIHFLNVHFAKTMVKQMPLRWEPRHHYSRTPDPLYATVSPPEAIQKSRVDQVLDHDHQRALERAVMNIISAPIAEETFAQIVDGLPLRDVACRNRHNRILWGDPVETHPELCPGALEKAKDFIASFHVVDFEIQSAVSHCLSRSLRRHGQGRQ